MKNFFLTNNIINVIFLIFIFLSFLSPFIFIFSPFSKKDNKDNFIIYYFEALLPMLIIICLYYYFPVTNYINFIKYKKTNGVIKKMDNKIETFTTELGIERKNEFLLINGSYYVENKEYPIKMYTGRGQETSYKSKGIFWAKINKKKIKKENNIYYDKENRYFIASKISVYYNPKDPKDNFIFQNISSNRTFLIWSIFFLAIEIIFIESTGRLKLTSEWLSEGRRFN